MRNEFEFDNEIHSDLHRTLNSLVKYNNGFFKSAKQSEFIRTNKRWEPCSWLMLDWGLFGIEVPEEAKVFNTSGMTFWASYGSKSMRPVTWVWVLDEYGVIGQYKLGYQGDMRRGTSPDHMKTKVLFVRDPDCFLPQFEEEQPKEETFPSQWQGSIGERLEFEATVTDIREVGYNGNIISTLVDEAGNVYNLWNKIAEKGDKIKVRATVKKHSEYRGLKQTMVNRPKVLEVLFAREMSEEEIEAQYGSDPMGSWHGRNY